MSQLTGVPYCIKYLLLIFNFLFWLLGCTIFGVGIWVRAEVISKTVIESTGYDYYFAACYIVIVAGLFIMLVGFLGCIGTLTESPSLLVIYIIILGIIFLLELAAGAYVFSVGLEGTSMDTFFENVFKTAIDRSGYDDNARRMLDTVQAALYCCGYYNWRDYELFGKPVPDSCRHEISGRQFELGCKMQLMLFIEQRTGAIGGLSLSICLIQIFGILFSLCLCRAIQTVNTRRWSRSETSHCQ